MKLKEIGIDFVKGGVCGIAITILTYLVYTI